MDSRGIRCDGLGNGVRSGGDRGEGDWSSEERAKNWRHMRMYSVCYV